MPAPYLLRKIGQTVIIDCLPAVTWFTLISVAVCVLADQAKWNLEVSTIVRFSRPPLLR
jgi:hypothetical protein